MISEVIIHFWKSLGKQYHLILSVLQLCSFWPIFMREHAISCRELLFIHDLLYNFIYFIPIYSWCVFHLFSFMPMYLNRCSTRIITNLSKSPLLKCKAKNYSYQTKKWIFWVVNKIVRYIIYYICKITFLYFIMSIS